MGALSDDMSVELQQIPPHWQIHGKVLGWKGRAQQLEGAIRDFLSMLDKGHLPVGPEAFLIGPPEDRAECAALADLRAKAEGR